MKDEKGRVRLINEVFFLRLSPKTTDPEAAFKKEKSGVSFDTLILPFMVYSMPSSIYFNSFNTLDYTCVLNGRARTESCCPEAEEQGSQ